MFQRPGVDGTALRRLGRKGKPFPVRAVVDVPNLTAGRVAINAYQLLVGADPVGITWEGQGSFAEAYAVAALDLRPVDLHSVAAAVGGINPPSLALLTVDWLLLAIALG